MRAPMAQLCAVSVWRSAEPDDVAVEVDVSAFAFAVVLVLRADDFHARLAPVGRDFVGVVNVDVEHRRHVGFPMFVECQVDAEVPPLREGVRPTALSVSSISTRRSEASRLES